MKRAKGTGTVFKLKGNRHRPYAAYVKGEIVFNEEKQTCYRTRKAIGYYATQKEAQRELENYLQNPYDLDLKNITFGEIFDKVYDTLQLSDDRMDAYKSTFNKYLKPIEKVPIREVKSAQMQAIIDACTMTSSVKTNIKTIMNKVFDYAMENDIIQKDYTQYVTFKRDATKVKREMFKANEIEIIKTRSNEWQYALLYILLYTGARPKEIIELKKCDVHEGCFDIIQSKTQAGIRTVPIHNELKELFDTLMKTDGEYLLTTEKGNKIQYQNYMQRNMPEIQETIGYPHKPYECRHSFISRAHELGIDTLSVQRIVGHKPTTITEQVYTHISIEKLKQDINKLYY